MIFRACLFIALIGSTFAQGPPVQIDPPGQAAVKIGEDLKIRCRLAMSLQFCRVEVPKEGSLVISNVSNLPLGNIKYVGNGLDKGECDILITNVKEAYDGTFRCALLPVGTAYESSAETQIVIAKPPQQPELTLSSSSSGTRNEYKKGEKLEISCKALGGKPSANVTLYLGDEKLNSDERPYYYDASRNDNSRAIQNVSRTLDWTDHGKEVKCVASHIALDRPRETKVTLNVQFPPQPQDIRMRFGYVIGQKGVVNVTIYANPRPEFTWIVDSERIQAGRPDSSNRLQSSSPFESGKGMWTVILTIDSVQKSDTEKQYTLEAKSTEGTELYEIKISTSSEPPGVDLDAGSIIGIVIGVMILILAVFLVVFARATGRWCFAGRRTTRNIGESSDTESAGRYSRSEVDSSSGRRRRPKITFSQLFKRNKDKVSGADTDTVRTNVTVDDEKIQTAEQTVETGKTGEKGLVYAELDLTQQQQQQEGGPRRMNDDKTEYAEILYTKPEAEEQSSEK